MIEGARHGNITVRRRSRTVVGKRNFIRSEPLLGNQSKFRSKAREMDDRLTKVEKSCEDINVEIFVLI
ncbi:hypothetical protein GQ457_01G026130 [Hibiscus cannabinus]